MSLYIYIFNGILIYDDIMKAKSFNGGNSGTTAVLEYAAVFHGKRSLKKINFKMNTGAWDTH